MGLSLLAVSVTLWALAVWLLVRFVNRRERWTKWTLACVAGLPVLYVASFGPACCLCENGILGQRPAWIFYRPVTWLACSGPMQVRDVIESYAKVCGDKRRLKAETTRIPPPKRYGMLGSTSIWLHTELQCDRNSASPLDLEFVYDFNCRFPRESE